MRRYWLVLSMLGVLVSPLLGADIEFITQELPWAVVDRSYSAPPLAVRSSGACPLGGVGYAVVSGGLPEGMELSRLGYFSGTPRRTGTYEFAVRVSNGCMWTARHYVLTVTGAPILTVSPLKLSFTWKPGTPLPRPQVLRVSATWPRFSYSVSSASMWLKATPEHGFTPRASSAMTEDFVAVSLDPHELRPGKYFSEVVVSGWDVLRAPTVLIELTVAVADAGPAGGAGSAPKELPLSNGSPTSASRP